MKKLATITFSAALALTSTTVFADKKTEAAIDYRQSVFTAVRWNFGTMGDMMKGKKDFDAAEFSSRADNVAALAKMPLEAFIPGSYKDSDDDTDALPAIGEDWKNSQRVWISSPAMQRLWLPLRKMHPLKMM